MLRHMAIAAFSFVFLFPLPVSCLLSHHTEPFALHITTGWEGGVPGQGLALTGTLQGWQDLGAAPPAPEQNSAPHPGAEASGG